jgi:RNA recognition motif-containing protein
MSADPSNAPGVVDRKLFVGGLMPFTNEQALGAHFQHFGAIEEVKIIYDKHTGRSKGYGFVRKL